MSDLTEALDLLDGWTSGDAVATALRHKVTVVTGGPGVGKTTLACAAARELGIHRTTLQRKIRKLGVTPPALDGRSRAEKG